MSDQQRQLRAIMFTDIVGYSAIVHRDEGLALTLLDEHRHILRAVFARHRGQEVNTMGDAFLVEFASALDAMRCALDIQQALADRNRDVDEERRIRVRVGVHVGEVVYRNGDVYGDGVNIASRIERLAGRGGICVSRQVVDQVRGRVDASYVSMGLRELRNIAAPVEVYRVQRDVGEARGEEEPVEWDPTRIAVLPLANVSPDPADEYFTDGMTGELIYTLSKVRGLKVIAQTSTMKYKGGRTSVAEIGRELNVGTVLEGAVRKVGDRLRITLQLIDVSTEGHLWSEAYEREVRDVFAVQNEIARRVAEALQVRLLASERRRIRREPTADVQAYMRYLEGRYFWNMRTEWAVHKAIERFEQAIAIDPDYALAYAGIADAYIVLADWGYVPLEEGFTKAKEAALKAMELDDTLAEPLASLAVVAALSEGDYEAAVAGMEQALELNPNYATAHHWYAELLSRMGRIEEALEHSRRALELDPLAPAINAEHGEALAKAGRYNDAVEQLQHTLQLSPGFSNARVFLAEVLQQTWRWEEAEREFKRAVELDPTFARARTQYGLHLVITDRPEEGLAEMRRASELAPEDPHSTHSLALLLLFLGDTQGARELAERTLSVNPGFPQGRIAMGLVHAAEGRFDDALAELRVADDLAERGYRMLDLDTALGQAFVYAWMDELDQVRRLTQHVLQMPDAPSRATVLAVMYFLVGDTQQGFVWLERACERRELMLRLLKLLPLPQRARDEPRFHAVLVRIGLAD